MNHDRPVSPLPEGPPVLAIEANRRTIRAVLVKGGTQLLDAHETSENSDVYVSLLPFIRKHLTIDSHIRLVASPLDNWSVGIIRDLEELALPLRWLAPNLVRDAFACVQPWHRKRRLHRALLLAYLASRQIQFDHYATEFALQWEYLSAQETISEIALAATMRAVNLEQPLSRNC